MKILFTLGLTLLASLSAHAGPTAAQIRDYVNHGRISGIQKFVDMKVDGTSLFLGDSIYYCVSCDFSRRQGCQVQQQGLSIAQVTLYAGDVVHAEKSLIRCE